MIYEISGNVITCTDERGSVPTSGRLLGASPIPRPEPAKVRLEDIKASVDACHQKCTVGAPCRRERCVHVEPASMEESIGVAMAASDVRRRERPVARPIDVAPPDPLAAMLSAGGVCVMRGRR